MSHKAQVRFCQSIQRKFPKHFINKRVVDVGSLDINGNNRRFFWFCHYTGIDLYFGKNVDRVGLAHEIIRDFTNVDTIISTEALEHDKFNHLTLPAMYKALKPGGLLLITCAGEGRKEHGTSEHSPTCSPGTNDFYCNVSHSLFQEYLSPTLFSEYMIRTVNTDLQFYGIKK